MPLPEIQPYQVPNILGMYVQGQQLKQGQMKNALAMRKMEADRRRAQQKAAIEKFKTLSMLMGSVNGPETYAIARERALRLYPEIKVPERYDPAWVDYQKKTFISLKDVVTMLDEKKTRGLSTGGLGRWATDF